ncbi:hypothetical protein [Chryseobacterium fistulae]|uniref:Elongation factor Tu n=1 Tax=Chryseobacterium fistulae TaxID=2675058 RepID=A0A6N4XP41_9FLAO|nr:hypothetical protein [Chryseobacterium fistulae]CAA7386365.1 hypothetical protein CHRY9393_00658 [Chryseobacterium fistulae]
MITIKAKLHLYNDIRKNPFTNGYRPAFDFGSESLTSGRILLLDDKKASFYPGETGEVEISFMFEEFVRDKLKIGEKIYFYEGPNRLGEINILEILDN